LLSGGRVGRKRQWRQIAFGLESRGDINNVLARRALTFFAPAIFFGNDSLPAIYALETYHIPPVVHLSVTLLASSCVMRSASCEKNSQCAKLTTQYRTGRVINRRTTQPARQRLIIHEDNVFRYRDDVPALGAKEFANLGRMSARQRMQLCAAEISYRFCLVVEPDDFACVECPID